MKNISDMTLTEERKLNRKLSILMKTIYRRKNGYWRAEYIKKHNMFHSFGENCYYEPNYLPSDSRLISIGNNVRIASNVIFTTHDVFHMMFNNADEYKKYGKYSTHLDTIEVSDNVCIGGGVNIMPGVKIGPNVIIAGAAVVTKDVPEGVIVGGNPAKIIGKVDELARRRANLNEPFWNSTREEYEKYYWNR